MTRLTTLGLQGRSSGFGVGDPGSDAPQGLWLSLLIPAYNHSEGVLRILNHLSDARIDGIECLINDDSTTDAVQFVVCNHRLYLDGKVTYRRNRPALGAVPNWNDLLDRAHGDYRLLMHHDECPHGAHFFGQLRAELTHVDSPDVLFLNCLVPSICGSWRSHMPLWIRRAIVFMSPEYLLRRNAIGPPSVVVFHRNCEVRFNPALSWLVDVDWMVRILRVSSRHARFARNLSVVHRPHASTSITTTLGIDIPRLCRDEARILSEGVRNPYVKHLMTPSNPLQSGLARLERLCWLLLRVGTRFAGRMSGRHLS